MRLLLALLLVAGPAAAQDWFQHRFGEERAYFGDWLAVCEAQGTGPCRAVWSGKDPGSDAFFDSRVSVRRLDGAWTIELMDRGMDAPAVGALALVVDGESIAIPTWKIGEVAADNVAETVTIIDPATAEAVLGRMRAGARMRLDYAPATPADYRPTVSLRGITAATDAILARDTR